jgi:hypothetical protein
VSYDNAITGENHTNPYVITMVDGVGAPTPLENVWGVRLYGLPQDPSTGPLSVPGDISGWVDTTEFQVSGSCSLTDEINLRVNLALNQTPIWSKAPVYDEDPSTYSGTAADPNLLTDGIYGINECDGRTALPGDSGTTDFVGVKFDTTQSDVTAVGITMYYNAHPDEIAHNGTGYLQHDTIKVQYTTDPNLDPGDADASSWTDVSNLDLGRLPDMEAAIQESLIANGQPRYVHTELLTFDAIDEDITGIRMIGTTAPLGSFPPSAIDPTGYLDCQEFEVFSVASELPPIPGDTNGNWIVDEADAQVLATNWGKDDLGNTGSAAGDFNGDGAVNVLDAAILAANWGDHTGGESVAAVPEPSAAVLLLGALMLFAAGRRRS